jgi:PPOX class probable F420-dependent enzyme
MAGEWTATVDYPQAPAMMDEELVSFFDEAIFARLGTFNEDGSIHIAPVFFKYDDGQILIATQDPSLKIRNIKRDNNVSVLIDTTDVPFKGALVYGKATLDFEDVVQKRIPIFERTRSYEEAEEYARRLSDKWQCVIVRVTPERITTFDYAKF